jgi:hypothetical protein
VAFPKKYMKGTFVTEVLLWLFFLLPGLIYSIYRLSSKYDGCPDCGAPNMIPVGSPAARAAGAALPRSEPVGAPLFTQPDEGDRAFRRIVFIIAAIFIVVVAGWIVVGSGILQ